MAKNEIKCVAQEHSANWSLYHGDSCEVIQGMPSNSIDFCIHSPPFSSLYIYSDSESDMGNCQSDDEFFRHYEFLIKELHRVTVPGRLCAVHCKDLPKYKNRDGSAGLSDFPGMIIRAFEDQEWTYHSRVTIWKCPVTEMQRTKNHGLLHKQLCKDSSASRQGMADYLIVFRKWEGWDGISPPKPVQADLRSVREAGLRFDSYVGSMPPGTQLSIAFETDGGVTSEVIRDHTGSIISARDMSIQVWQRYASPVWFDVHQTRVLNYRLGRDGNDEKHICPLQLDVIERAIHLWTNPGDVVLTPFAGIGSEVYSAVKMNRRGVGIELKDSYFREAIKNCKFAEQEARKRSLFDLPILAAIEAVEFESAPSDEVNYFG